jgi:molybdopterin molybdotransferase
VVREESTELRGDRVRFRHDAHPGENVRPAGEDVAAGGEALPAGTRLGPRQVALLEAVGCEAVLVHRRVRVAVVATGDEVVRGRTPDSNGTALAGSLAECGFEVRRSAVGDDVDALRGAVGAALAGADALVTVGGVSVGEKDLVAGALEGLGASIRVHGVPMKPGKPFLFALLDGKPVLGLPGSPSACLVAFEVFARPALLRLAGAGRVERPRAFLPVAERCEGRPGRARFLWATIDADGRARPVGRDAAQVRGPALAQALLRIPEGAGDVAEGQGVETWLLGE